jgi:hypothetical protein
LTAGRGAGFNARVTPPDEPGWFVTVPQAGTLADAQAWAEGWLGMQCIAGAAENSGVVPAEPAMRETPIGIGQHRPNAARSSPPSPSVLFVRGCVLAAAYRRLLENQHFFSSVNHLTLLA